MIVIGFPGVGKSTLAKTNKDYIDLESSNFVIPGTNLKITNWEQAYVNIAEDLSRQGYTVFVSSHKMVRNQLLDSSEEVLAIVPSLELRDEWIQRLRERAENSKGTKEYEKNRRALDHIAAGDNFEKYVEDIFKDGKFVLYVITAMDYKLESILPKAISISSLKKSIDKLNDDQIAEVYKMISEFTYPSN